MHDLQVLLRDHLYGYGVRVGRAEQTQQQSTRRLHSAIVLGRPHIDVIVDVDTFSNPARPLACANVLEKVREVVAICGPQMFPQTDMLHEPPSGQLGVVYIIRKHPTTASPTLANALAKMVLSNPFLNAIKHTVFRKRVLNGIFAAGTGTLPLQVVCQLHRELLQMRLVLHGPRIIPL